jgi:hypothetical protein
MLLHIVLIFLNNDFPLLARVDDAYPETLINEVHHIQCQCKLHFIRLSGKLYDMHASIHPTTPISIHAIHTIEFKWIHYASHRIHNTLHI